VTELNLILVVQTYHGCQCIVIIGLVSYRTIVVDNNCPTRCDLFSLLYFCRQLYMFRV